jgi:acetyl esterase/lipase
LNLPRRIPYGADPLQFGELSLPDTAAAPYPAAIVIHGGFWRAKYDLDYIRPACAALADAGIATWNIEYRRIGNPGGGWPGTLEDVAAAAGHLATIAAEFQLDPARFISIGHSAGGHLAFWLAAQRKQVRAAISLAGVVDLRRAWELKLSDNVVGEFLGGGPEEVPDRYAFASPIERLPFGVRLRLFHGTADPNVPLEISAGFVRRARDLGDDAELIALPGASHFDVVDPRKKEFAIVKAAALGLVGADGKF